MTTQSPASSVSASTIPKIPAPAPVSVDAKTSALLILDINTAVCQPNPACTATVPAIASLLNKARAAKVPVVYASTVNPAGPPATLAAVAPQAGEPVVVSRANKFTGTDLEDILKQRNAGTLVIVGSAANGAVMYTSFHANTRGFTVVVAEDGLSSPVPINTQLARYQLLNQPGFINADNTPMADKKVTLSGTDLITFK
jgi:nicotinamidase-related amidase